MIPTLSDFLVRFSGLSWLTGPIFAKELRVSSRRRRNYVLRFAYVVLLMVFISYVWRMTARPGGPSSAVYQQSRMPEIGKHIVTTVVWFQFIAIQIIAVVMMSSAISEEIRHRTLGVLMTTPIGGLQIVLGKLLSKLLLLTLLLAISMPLLAIVRVFGGVPWSYVISSLCVTLTAAVFAGAVSLTFSTYTRQAQQVMARTLLTCFVLYAVPSIVVQLLQVRYGITLVPYATLAYANPFIVMISATVNMLSAVPGIRLGGWVLHCAIMSVLSALLLMLSTISVRKVGLRQATGQPGIFASRKERQAARANRRAQRGIEVRSGRVIPVQGPPIVWKDMRTLLARSSRLMPLLSASLAGCVLVVAYAYCGYKGWLSHKEAHTAFIAAYLFLGLLRAATSAATSVTSEKEARTWPALLSTALTDRQIVFGKIIGSALQGWPSWLLLAAHVLVFTFAGHISIVAAVPLAVLAVCSALLFSAVGVLFSSLFKRSSVAASVNLIAIFAFNFPLCCPVPTFLVNPIFVSIWIQAVTGGWAGDFPFFGRQASRYEAFLASGLALIVLLCLYLLVAFAASAIAMRKIRRRVF
jgi:ABC-type transport system involved in multi-copper enzyme maturation permease subunit